MRRDVPGFPRSGHICDRIWENPPYSYFRENRDRAIFKMYYLCSNFETDHPLCFRDIVPFVRPRRTIKLVKLRSKGVTMRAHPISVYYKCTEIACGRGASIYRNTRTHGDENDEDMTFDGVFQRIVRRALLSAS